MPPKKEKSIPNDREREKEEEKKLAEELMATTLGRTYGVTDEQLAAAGLFEGFPTNPDNPPCDGCKQPFAGTSQCSRCESVFYCNRDCQVSHWSDRHKAECKLIKKKNEETARRVLSDFKEYEAWTNLDVAGTYKAAVHQGLHNKIREVLERDTAGIMDRYLQNEERKYRVGYARVVMSELFRGDRAEGTVRKYARMDGNRIKGYVLSHPDALDVWLKASVEIIRVFANCSAQSMPLPRREAFDDAVEAWSAWYMVFTSSTAARAVLSPFPLPKDSAAQGARRVDSAEQRRKRGEDHIRGIVKILAEALRLVGSFTDPRADFSLYRLQECVQKVAAMVHVRAEEYGFRVDVAGILKLNDVQRRTFEHMEIPLAKRTIEKGRDLTMQEAHAVLALSFRRLGLQ